MNVQLANTDQQRDSSETRSRDADRTREAILRAASRLFAQQGYEATTMAQIASAAGVSRGTPSYFFGSKEGLWKAVLDAQSRAAMEVAPRALARLAEVSDVGERIAALVDSYFEFLEENPDFFRLIQWSELQGNPLTNEVTAHWEALERALQAVSGVLSGKAAGEDPRQVVMSVIGLCNAHLVYGQTLGTPLGLDVRSPEFLASRRAHLKRFLIAALT